MQIVPSPLISIIMSVYNGELYLEAAIKSILNQTHKNIEFIIVNDGSTDNSLSIIKKYMEIDNRIVLLDQNNIGLTKSLNKAINISKGAYIARQDADDESISSRLETQLSHIIKHNLDLVTSRAIKNSKSVPNISLLLFNKINTFQRGNLFIHGSFFGKKDIFNSIKYNENYIYAQDFKFILDCFKNNIKIGYIVEPLYIINDLESNISNTKKDEQNHFVSSSLIEYFGTDKYFKRLSKVNAVSLKTLTIVSLLFLQLLPGKYAFTIIKK